MVLMSVDFPRPVWPAGRELEYAQLGDYTLIINGDIY
jgi:hypothetical protein